MRILALALAAASLALVGCGKKQATGNTSAIDQAVTAEDFAANDATAIDAATGADANMAADVDISLIENDDNQARPSESSRNRPRPGTEPSAGNTAAPSPAPAPVTEPANETAQSNSN